MELTAKSHSVSMNNGLKMPLMGIGTYADPRTVSGYLLNESFAFLTVLFLFLLPRAQINLFCLIFNNYFLDS